MSENDTPPVACTLTPEQLDNRPKAIRETLAARYAGANEVDDGVTIRFEGTDDALVAASQFAANELQCCSFAEYRIETSPPYEETRLTITGPDGTKTMMQQGLVERLEAESPD